MSAQTEAPISARIHTVRIFPPIGIARVGNSVESDGWYYGPEVPGRFCEPVGGFKDVRGAVKRQVRKLSYCYKFTLTHIY
jgi:hypothetical protein